MAKIERFEDIEAWQEARVLGKMIYDAVKSNKALAEDYRFRKQMEGVAYSVMSNIADGFSRRSTKEFAGFISAAEESLLEVQRQLRVALDQDYLNRERFDELHSKAEEIAGLIADFNQYLLNKGKLG
jgi:four helix bundle protein